MSAAVGIVGSIASTHRLREWIVHSSGALEEVLGNYQALVKCFPDSMEDGLGKVIAHTVPIIDRVHVRQQVQRGTYE